MSAPRTPSDFPPHQPYSHWAQLPHLNAVHTGRLAYTAQHDDRTDARLGPDLPAHRIGFAPSTGLRATSGRTPQNTEPRMVPGLPDGYQRNPPTEIHSSTGSTHAMPHPQQTAANLHASVGDTITIEPPGSKPAAVTVGLPTHS
ncbi:hypothetical protein [Actinacidiphila glaucinigra]